MDTGRSTGQERRRPNGTAVNAEGLILFIFCTDLLEHICCGLFQQDIGFILVLLDYACLLAGIAQRQSRDSARQGQVLLHCAASAHSNCAGETACVNSHAAAIAQLPLYS